MQVLQAVSRRTLMCDVDGGCREPEHFVCLRVAIEVSRYVPLTSQFIESLEAQTRTGRTGLRRQLFYRDGVAKGGKPTSSSNNRPVFRRPRLCALRALSLQRKAVLTGVGRVASKRSHGWSRRGDIGPWNPNVQAFARARDISSRRMALLRALAPSPTALHLFALYLLHGIADASGALEFALQERAGEQTRVDGALKRVYGHEFRRLAHFLGHARVPVLDFDEDAFTVVVPRVTHV